MNPGPTDESRACLMFLASPRTVTTTTMQTVAFLGLGAIGAPIATHLAPPATGLRVWNRTAAKAEEFAARTGAQLARSPADAARGADIVITCFPTSREVE